jgi:DNA-binding response OmpR family regulator
MTRVEHSTQPGSRGSVVVVDDHENVRRMLCLALTLAGYEAIGASSELSLRRLLVDVQPTAVVIDMQRSEADGLDLIKSLRSRPELQQVPILFLSGTEDEFQRRLAMQAGADAYAVRPIGMVELQDRVAGLVHHTHNAQKARRPSAARLKQTG